MTRFNAHHAPIGAYATFTLGGAGRGGGLGLEASLPPDAQVYVGVRAPDRAYEALPFFDDGARALAAARSFGAAVDAWEAPGVALRIFSPWRPVPEPGVASAAGAVLDGLRELRRLQLAHAIRSCYGNTVLLAEGDAPLWAVVEGRTARDGGRQRSQTACPQVRLRRCVGRRASRGCGERVPRHLRARRGRRVGRALAGRGRGVPVGSSRGEVEARMKEALVAHLELLQEAGRPVPEPRTEAGRIAA